MFFGGWSFFGLTDHVPVLSLLVFVIKVAVFLFFFIWLRATLPRIRYDHLMRLGWQTLLPLAVLNVVITAVCVALNWPWYISGIAGLVIILAVLFFLRNKSLTEGTRIVEKPAQGVVQIPASVRLVKFENTAATVDADEQPTAQDSEAVKV